jgi:hypothetical protein
MARPDRPISCRWHGAFLASQIVETAAAKLAAMNWKHLQSQALKLAFGGGRDGANRPQT